MTNIFSFAVVCIKILAMLVLLQAVTAIPAVLVLITRFEPGLSSRDELTMGVLGAGTHIMLATLLLVFAKPLARFVTKGLEQTESHLDGLGHDGLLSTGLSILGAYVLVYDIPTFLKLVWPTLFYKDSPTNFLTTAKPVVPSEVIAEYAIRIAFAIFLVFGSAKIVSRLRKWRTAKPPIEPVE
jgi:hypothetical protein